MYTRSLFFAAKTGILALKTNKMDKIITPKIFFIASLLPVIEK